MYSWRLGDRISFNHGGYGWHGIVTEIQDIDGNFWYMVKLNQACIRAYNIHINHKDPDEILVNERCCYL